MIDARRVAVRWLAFGASLVAVLLASGQARAQTTPAVTGIVGSVLRLEPDGSNADSYSSGNPHPGGVPENVINYSDCEANLSYQFTLSLSATFSQYDLVVWAGDDDCTAAAARESGSATCWPVLSGPIAQTGGVDDAGAPTAVVTIAMRDIVGQAPSGQAKTTTYTPATSAACTAQDPSTAGSAPALYFFFTDHVGPGDAVGIAQAYPLNVDTVAQNIGATGFTVSQPVDEQLTVAIAPATVDPDTVVYNVYCDPPPGQESATTLVPYDAATNNGVCVDSSTATPSSTSDAASEGGEDAAQDASEDALASGADSGGASSGGGSTSSGLDDAGGNSCGAILNDAGIPGASGCSESILKSGGGTEGTTSVVETDDAGNDVYGADGGLVYVEAGTTIGGTMTLGIPSKYLCGTVPASDPTLNLTGLRDGYFYTIAVAAVDSAGNVGPLAVQCQEPEKLADFWYDYTTAGGQAGGGYCAAAESVGAPAGMSGLGILVVACGVAIVRRRRRAG